MLAVLGIQHDHNEPLSCHADLAMMALREGVHQIQDQFTLERATPGEQMRRKAIHAPLDILLDETDPLMRLAMMKSPSA